MSYSQRLRFTLTIGLLCLACSRSQAAITPIIESFDGDGPFSTLDGAVVGLDNPGWNILNNGEGELANGGYTFNLDPQDNLQYDNDMWIDLPQFSYVERIELRNIESSVSHGIVGGGAAVQLSHIFNGLPGNSTGITLSFPENDDMWRVRVGNGQDRNVYSVPKGTNISLGMEFDETKPEEVIFSFDHNIDDDVPPMEFIHHYHGIIDENQRAIFFAFAYDFGALSGTLDNWTILPHPSLGDYNVNGMLDVMDVELLSSAVREGSDDSKFDLNGDTVVDEFDRNVWVKTLRTSWFGDSNLDGEFNTRDLVSIFAAGEYEDSIADNSTWETGDWNGDQEFNTRDLVFAFQDGGYEAGPRSSAHAVPEPSSSFLLFFGLLFTVHHQQNKNRVG